MLRPLLTAFLMACLAIANSLALAAEPDPLVAYSKQGKFDDVRDDLRLAIEGKGLVIDYHSHVNGMLERTGKDLGSAQPIYLDAQAFVFCSASLSRKMMEADPLNVALCPFVMVVYATAKEPEKVHVAYRRPLRRDASPATKSALKDIEQLLDSIARDAVGQN